MKHKIVLVQLTDEQVVLAKEANGQRRQITHAVICGPHGQLFGTEVKCRKYYSAWSRIFPHVFDEALETDEFNVNDYKETFNLVNALIELNNPPKGARKQNISTQSIQPSSQGPKGFLARLWAGIFR